MTFAFAGLRPETALRRMSVTRKRVRLEENLASANVSLTRAELAAIEAAIAAHAVEGKRYGDNEMSMLNL